MPASLVRYLLSVALVLAVIACTRSADATPTKVGDATARELAAQSRPTAKAAPPARPRARAKAAPHAKPVKPHATKAHTTAKAKPKSDLKVKANATKARAKPARTRPSAPAKAAVKPVTQV